MDCGIKGCNKAAVNTYSYGAPLKPNPYMAENLTIAVPLCEEHSKRRPDSLSCGDLN